MCNGIRLLSQSHILVSSVHSLMLQGLFVKKYIYTGEIIVIISFSKDASMSEKIVYFKETFQIIEESWKRISFNNDFYCKKCTDTKLLNDFWTFDFWMSKQNIILCFMGFDNSSLFSPMQNGSSRHCDISFNRSSSVLPVLHNNFHHSNCSTLIGSGSSSAAVIAFIQLTFRQTLWHKPQRTPPYLLLLRSWRWNMVPIMLQPRKAPCAKEEEFHQWRF